MSFCLTHMQQKSRSLLSLQLLSFITPRHGIDPRTVPLFVILHCWCTVRLSSVEALLTCPKNRDDSIKFTVTSRTPLDISPDIRCPDFRLNPLFFDFVNSSSKDSGSNVDSASFFLRVDIEGGRDDKLTPIASNEPQSRTWIFNATFDYFTHSALVGACPEDAANYVRATLNQTFVKDVDFFRLLCRKFCPVSLIRRTCL